MKKKIVIVGGGTAGWVTLGYLSSTIDADFTIIYSEEVDPIGVGESTTPIIKHVTETIGVNEDIWMKKGKASFKYGIEMMNFNSKGSRWLHSFDDLLPGQTFETPISEFGKDIFMKETSSVEFFLTQQRKSKKEYDTNFFNQSHGGCDFLLRNKLSPYSQENKNNFNKFPGYAYHLNAFEFGNSIRESIPKEKYTEIKDTVTDIEIDDTGIKSLTLTCGKIITADLYIDCTGFKKLLIGKFTKFIKYKGLKNNSAVWGPVKHPCYRPSTISSAQSFGWIWETPTWGQQGSGYVYSNDFIREDQAIDHLRKYWNNKGINWEPLKSIKFESGRMEQMAYKNVISNGLSQSFIEPLEATSITVICVTVRNISKLYNKHNGWTAFSSKIFSKAMSNFLEETKDFVEAHYTLSDRTDTDYWLSYDRDNVVEKISNIVENKLKREWLLHADTTLNGFNWASMLVGFNKPYLGKLPKISDNQLDNYEFYTNQLIQNYEWIYTKNQTVEQKLKLINN
jgi:tryptophan halogenase